MHPSLFISFVLVGLTLRASVVPVLFGRSELSDVQAKDPVQSKAQRVLTPFFRFLRLLCALRCDHNDDHDQ